MWGVCGGFQLDGHGGVGRGPSVEAQDHLISRDRSKFLHSARPRTDQPLQKRSSSLPKHQTMSGWPCLTHMHDFGAPLNSLSGNGSEGGNSRSGTCSFVGFHRRERVSRAPVPRPQEIINNIYIIILLLLMPSNTFLFVASFGVLLKRNP